MMRATFAALVLVFLSFLITPGIAQENDRADDLKAIRKLLEEQAVQLQELSSQIKSLREHTAAPSLQDQNEKKEDVATPQTAEGTRSHVVARGETLTSIAKKYKINVPDVLKLNKISDERKLQIGQTLIVPQATAPQNPDDKN